MAARQIMSRSCGNINKARFQLSSRKSGFSFADVVLNPRGRHFSRNQGGQVEAVEEIYFLACWYLEQAALTAESLRIGCIGKVLYQLRLWSSERLRESLDVFKLASVSPFYPSRWLKEPRFNTTCDIIKSRTNSIKHQFFSFVVKIPIKLRLFQSSFGFRNVLRLNRMLVKQSNLHRGCQFTTGSLCLAY